MVELSKLLSGLQSRRKQRLPDLGGRELLVLEVLWERGELTARRVQDLMPDAGISLSTVQSTLERLYRKGLVERSKTGRAYHYFTLMSKAELISGLIRDIAENLADGDLAPMLSGFLNYISAEAPELAGSLSKSLRIARPHDKDAESDDE